MRLTAEGSHALEHSFEGRRERLRQQLTTWETQDIAELARLLRLLNDTAV